MEIYQTVNNQTSTETQTGSPHQHASKAAVSIAGCAFLSFILGSLWGAPWQGAVVACAMCLMGVVVAYFIMRRA